MTFSNFAPGNAYLLPCSGLTSFSYDILLNYEYPISGKTLSGGLEMTYNVYADNGSLLESQKTIKISPNNITTNSFKFNMCIPFRRINIFKISKISYLKNITIKDANGYTAKGISDPLLGNILSEVKLTR